MNIYNIKFFFKDKTDSPLNFEAPQHIDLDASDKVINLLSTHHLINEPIQFSCLSRDCNFKKIFDECSKEEHFNFSKLKTTDLDESSTQNSCTNLSEEEVNKSEKDINNKDEGISNREINPQSDICYENTFEELIDNKKAEASSHSLHDIGKQWRKFNFDLLPKVTTISNY